MPRQGRKDDAEKPRWDLLPIRATAEVVDVLTSGAAKYGDNNWQHIDLYQARYLAAAYRHLAAYRLGELNDDDTDKHHLAHAVCCLLFLIAFDLGFDPKEDA